MNTEAIQAKYEAWRNAVDDLERAQDAGVSSIEVDRLKMIASRAKAALDAARGGTWEERRRVYVWGNPRG